MTGKLKHVALFAGIHGFKGFDDAGMETVAFVEIDKDCQRVLRKQCPGVPIIADVREAGRHNLPDCDVVSFGSPCQDLSIAGKRAGLGGERSGLFFEAIRIIDELRPSFAVWENVPNAIQSASGRDFLEVLNSFRRIGARDIAWRILDARHFGVPQRRRRIFLVADFRGERAGQILFEPSSRYGDSPTGRKTGQEVAGTIGTLPASGAGTARPAGQGNELDFLITSFDARNLAEDGETTNTLQAKQSGGYSLNYMPVVAFLNQGAKARSIGISSSVSPTLKAGASRMDQVPVVDVQCLNPADPQTKRIYSENGIAATLASSDGGGGQRTMSVMSRAGVRRLTPTECERLMGFPDNWTAVDANGKPISDSARYRMLGNSVVTFVTQYLGERIVKAASDDQ